MTQTSITLKATSRASRGKGPARRLRSAGNLPAVVYGPGHEARAISINPKDIKTILAADHGRNTVVTLDVEGTTSLAMLKSFDHHPITRALEHADFYTVTLDRPVIVPVPLVTTGRARGVASEGGLLREIYRTIPVRCTPEKIPVKIEVDVTNLGLGQGVHVRELVLPEGVTVMLDGGQTLAAVVSPEKGEGEGAPTGEGAAATPGAPAAAAAATPAAAAKPAAGGKDAGKGDKGGKDKKK